MIEVETDVGDLFTHFVAIGLASILEDRLGTVATIEWADQRHVILRCGDVDLEKAATVVHNHAADHARGNSWVVATAELGDKTRGVLSPRVTRFADPVAKDARALWEQWQSERRSVIDAVAWESWLDFRFIGALGEPSYWQRLDRNRTFNPDLGASLWEMKTRNKGEEFVQNRLGPLARAVAARSIDQVAQGLSGDRLVDEAGKNSLDSRTPTGLRAPGPADNAQAWCALWGLNAMPTRPVAPTATRGQSRSHTAGAIDFGGGKVLFAVPVPIRPVTLARFRAVARSAALSRFVIGREQETVPSKDGTKKLERDAQTSSAAAWLTSHGIGGVAVAERYTSGNPNAPEHWARRARYEATGVRERTIPFVLAHAGHENGRRS